MAKHSKKSQNKLLIATCVVSAFLILISWSWLLLYIPPISNNAEGFLSKYLKQFFIASENEDIKAQDQQNSEDSIETATSSEDKNSQSEETQETKSSENNEPAKPTIRLKIYEGPLYSASDDTCYYKVKAVVTGKPAPTIKFSKDDSEGLLGSGMAQINHLHKSIKLKKISRKPSKKTSRKASKKTSRKTSRKTYKKTSRKASRKTSKKAYRKKSMKIIKKNT